MAMQLERRLGVPVNVINATGGSGVTGFTRGARSRADGYTLMMMTVELSMLHWRGLTTITQKDFAPLSLLNRDAAAVFVRGDAPFHSLADLEEAIRAAAVPLKASGTAQGGIWHAAVAGWLDSQGLPSDAVTWVSLNGSGPSLQELMAGGLDIVCCSVAEADALLASKRVQCLGVMAEKRLPAAPEIPTFREQGVDWEMAGWRGLGVPAGVPAERLEILREAVEAEATHPEFQDFLAVAGFDHSFEPADAFTATLDAQDRLFERVMTSEALGGVAADARGGLVFPSTMAVLLLAAVMTAVVLGKPQHASLTGRGKSHPWSFFNWATPQKAEGFGRHQSPHPAAAGFFHSPLAECVAAESTTAGRLQVFTVVLVVAAFIGIVDLVGFFIAASGLLFVLLLLFGTRPLPAVALSLVAAGTVQLLFVGLLRVPLPRGLWLDS